LTHLCLCPAFQCCVWQATEQYHDSMHLEQRLGAPPGRRPRRLASGNLVLADWRSSTFVSNKILALNGALTRPTRCATT
jgi:hypothetical protein